MSKRKHAAHDEEHENSERWLLTYADMITLLMVLFIVLFAIGQTDLKKFAAFKHSFHSGGGSAAMTGGNGVLNGSAAAANTPVPGSSSQTDKVSMANVEATALTGARKQIQAALSSAGLNSAVQFRSDPRGLVVTIVTDHVLFETGSAVLTADGNHVIDAIAPSLLKLPNQISIEGHTDNQPILGGGLYPTNWELSTGRATSVLRYLIDAHHVPGSRLSAAGYADQRPVAPNDTPANRAKNRRVDIVILSSVPTTP